MTVKNIIKRHIDGHRIFFFLILCLFGLCLVQAMQAPKKRARKRAKEAQHREVAALASEVK